MKNQGERRENKIKREKGIRERKIIETVQTITLIFFLIYIKHRTKPLYDIRFFIYWCIYRKNVLFLIYNIQLSLPFRLASTQYLIASNVPHSQFSNYSKWKAR